MTQSIITTKRDNAIGKGLAKVGQAGHHLELERVQSWPFNEAIEKKFVGGVQF